MTTLDQMQSELNQAAAAVDARFQRDANTIATLLDAVKRLGKITTERHGHGWCAIDDNYDGAPDGKGFVGHGSTELEAVLDLLEQQD